MPSDDEMRNSTSMQPFDFLGRDNDPSESGSHVPDPMLPTSYAAFADEAGDSTAQQAQATVTTDGDDKASKELAQGVYIGLFAILGTFVRIILAQLFGEYCQNPDTIGWLAASAPLCVTQSGATQQGGIIFADLPANMLGSFIMGFFQNGAALGLALPMAIAWMRLENPFQDMPILHKAITTGFCGSLTTFSGWNSAMVVILFGTGNSRSTHVFNAIFGYIIGMETAMGSFVAGKSLARRLHQIINPILAAEAEANKERSAEGVYLNPNLPDFERRFLPDLNMGEKGEKDYGGILPMGKLDSLEHWRASTKEARRVNHPQLALLNRIEETVLVHGLPPPFETISLAKSNGWDIEALQTWATSTFGRPDRLPSFGSATMMSFGAEGPSRLFEPAFASVLLAIALIILLVLVLLLNGKNSYTITYRTMAYAMLFAPPGALLRWKLSALNGTMKLSGWEWFPLGTFAANLIGSVISITAIGAEYDMESIYDVTYFWGVGSIRAVKVGFAGSLSTVSTFVAEINGFMQKSDHAYPYIFTTIITCCAIASFFYGGLLFLRQE